MVRASIEMADNSPSERSYQQHFNTVASANRYAADHWRGFRHTVRHYEARDRLSGQLDEVKARNGEWKLNDVIGRMHRADEHIRDVRFVEGADDTDVNIKMAAERLSTFSPDAAPRFFSDFDGTLTDPKAPLRANGNLITLFGTPLGEEIYELHDLEGNSFNPHEYYVDPTLSMIPGSKIAEPLLARHGRDAFLDIYPGVWAPLQASRPDVFRRAGRFYGLRPGTLELFQDLAEREISVTVLSANMQEVVEGGLSRVPLGANVNIKGISPNDVTSLEKPSIIKEAMIDDPETPVFCVGDGDSDRGIALDPKVSRAIVAHFVLRGGSYERDLKMLQQKGEDVCVISYDNMHDVRIAFERIEDLAFRGRTGNRSPGI